jgi:hypothetical protein
MNLCSGCSTVLRGVVLICVVQKIALATPTCPPLVLNLLPNPFPSVSRLSAACPPLTSHSSPLVRCWFPHLFPACLLPLVCLLSPACRPSSLLVSRLPPTSLACLSPICLPLIFHPASPQNLFGQNWRKKIIAHAPGARIRCGLTLDCTGKAIYAQPMAGNLLRFFSGAVNFMALPPPLQECCGNLSRALRELFGLLWTFCILG